MSDIVVPAGIVLPWPQYWKVQIITAFAVICLPFYCTRLFTTMKLEKALRNNSKIKEAPTVPYTIPIVAHAFSMGLDITRFNLDIAHRFRHLPVRIRAFFTDIYVVTGPEYISSVWKQSQLLRNEVYRRLVVHNMFGMPKGAANFYLSDDSGIQHTPFHNSKVAPDQRIKYLTHLSMAKLLSGSGLKPFAERFATNVVKQLDARNKINTEWTHLPNFFHFFRDELLIATTRAICGEHLLQLNPSWTNDFWDFDNGVPSLAKRFPWWLAPSAYAARDRCLGNLKKWYEFVEREVECNSEAVDVKERDSLWGSEFMKSRHDMWSKIGAMNADAQASEDLGLIWGANANSISTAFWLIYEVFRDPSLLQQVRKEVHDCRDMSRSEPLCFDMSALCSKPLLQSIYAETLRLYVSTSIIRSPEDGDLHLGKWTIPKGALLMIPSYVIHRDSIAWSPANPDESRPVETFWPERFLTYPKPLQSFDSTTTAQQPNVTSPTKDHGSSIRSSASFSLENLSDCFMPYGGGHGICPGRHFAKYEIITSLAIFVTLFDIEFLETNGPGKLQPDLAGFGFGALKPKGTVPARIRRRDLSQSS